MAVTIDFGDIEPEDSWDRGDPVPVLLDNLFRRLALLGQVRLVDGRGTDREQLGEVTHLMAHARLRDDLTERDHLRIDDIADDIGYLRERLDDESDERGW
jgi:hypothetical protein